MTAMKTKLYFSAVIIIITVNETTT